MQAQVLARAKSMNLTVKANTCTLRVSFQTNRIADNHECVPSRALCQAVPQQVPKVVEQLNPMLSSVYDAQRIVAAAFFAEVWKAYIIYLVTKAIAKFISLSKGR